MELNIGISRENREAIAAGLSRLLADSYTLYLKTHNYHWNVTGPQFNTLHQMFEEQYTELAAAVDEIAERIRALGVRAPGSYREYAELTNIEEGDGNESAEEMIRQLAVGQESVVRMRPTTNRRQTCSPSACKFMRRTPGCCAACWHKH